MSDKSLNLIKAICLIVIACSSVFIAVELGEIKDNLWNIVMVLGNK
ncbi:MAG: hypothetical protein R3328_05920 [Planococcaceae bacterium]|nr:hypothetical protein [Planococcaceae bacterium]